MARLKTFYDRVEPYGNKAIREQIEYASIAGISLNSPYDPVQVAPLAVSASITTPVSVESTALVAESASIAVSRAISIPGVSSVSGAAPVAHLSFHAPAHTHTHIHARLSLSTILEEPDEDIKKAAETVSKLKP